MKSLNPYNLTRNQGIESVAETYYRVKEHKQKL